MFNSRPCSRKRSRIFLVSLLGLALAACKQPTAGFSQPTRNGFPEIKKAVKKDGTHITITVDPSTIGASNNTSLSVTSKHGSTEQYSNTSDGWSGTGDLSVDIQIDGDSDVLYLAWSTGEIKEVRVEDIS